MTINFRYTYGKGVVGDAVVTVSTRYDTNPSKIHKMLKVQYTYMLFLILFVLLNYSNLQLNKDGQAIFLITNQELLRSGVIVNETNSYLSVEASVTETLSGSQINATAADTTVYFDKYEMSISQMSDLFHPGLDFDFVVCIFISQAMLS